MTANPNICPQFGGATLANGRRVKCSLNLETGLVVVDVIDENGFAVYHVQVQAQDGKTTGCEFKPGDRVRSTDDWRLVGVVEASSQSVPGSDSRWFYVRWDNKTTDYPIDRLLGDELELITPANIVGPTESPQAEAAGRSRD